MMSILSRTYEASKMGLAQRNDLYESGGRRQYVPMRGMYDRLQMLS